jgi:hypothetical protein
MDKSDLINRRRGRYLAKVLGDFEDTIAPLIPPGNEAAVEAFKGRVRANINALASDATELVELHGVELNGVAQDLRDTLYPHNSPTRTPVR